MTRKELKKLITENFDESLIKGETSFTVEARELMTMTFKPYTAPISDRILWVDLDFGNGNGLIRLETKNFNRKQMIGIFTNIVYAIWFDYKD